MTIAENTQYDPDQHYRIQYTAPQSNFLRSTATYPLFVAGYGSGKSMAMAGSVVKDLLDFPGAHIACYEPTFDLMQLIIIPYVSEILEGTLTWNIQTW